MKKFVKWALIVLGMVVVLIVAAGLIIPVVFKDDIKQAIDKELAKSVNADVLFELDKFSLSLFKNFPNVTAELGDLGVVNREPFAGEVLFVTQKFQVEVNLADLLFGDQLRIKGISLVQPIVNIHVLKDGRANWDIAIPSEDTVVTSSEPSEFSFGIDHWEIVDGDVTYNDESIPTKVTIKGLNHSGGGDFTQDVFDLRTSTVMDTISLNFDGGDYLTNKKVALDAIIEISEEYTRYAFKENSAKVNDFAMSFDGWLKMNDSSYDMDLNFKSPENSFKSILSLVPGMYTSSFSNIETNGELAFSGLAKGTYSDTQLPAFSLNLLVKDAMFKYPDLPTAVNNINIDLLVDNKDGVMENTVVNLKKLHLDFGTNPVDAHALITKLYPTDVDANVNAKLNLAELTKMIPMEGLELHGNYAIDLTAKGVYDSVKSTIPSIDATMSLANGYVKSSEFPLPLENIKLQSTVKSPSGKMSETVISVSEFSMTMDNEPFTASMVLQNLENYNWDVNATGGVDLEKITKVFPVEGMTLAGIVKADIHTRGQYSDLEAERYDKLPTSGTASLKNFKYTAADLPAVTISDATMSFDPKKINLQKCDGTIGRSDFAVDGAVFNYLGYALGKNETVQGNVNFRSTLLDLNEFMTDAEATTDTESEESYGVIPVPDNIDFVLKSTIKTARMMDYTITNATGDIVVKDGIANLNGLHFNMLGGAFTLNGAYNTKDINHPKYDMALKIEKLSIKQAASSFSLVQTYAPIAGLVNGDFSTDFKLSGELKQDMTPNMGTVNAGGLIKIAQAALTESKLVSGITSLTKLDDSNMVTLKDVVMSASIKDGRLSVKPFDVKFGNYKTNIAGSTGLDGSLDYSLKMDVPAGKLGQEFNSFLAQYNGGSKDPNSTVPLVIGLGGSYDSPAARLVMDEQKAQVKQAVTTAAKEEGTKAVQQAVKGTEAEKVVESLLGGNKKDTTKTDSTKAAAAEDVKKKVEEEAKKKIQNLLKKKNN